jgi:polyhydroxybutyrate depolymerase
MQLTVDGRARTYQLVRPSEQGPRPTVIMLHGLGGTGAEIAKRSGLDQSAPRAGFVGVFPDGVRNRWNSFPPGTEPALYVERNREFGGTPDDVAFLKALVADLVRRGISDPKRIYLAGVSNGGFMTLRMICADAGLLAAAAVLVSGMLDPTGADCRPAKPVPVLMVNGTADPIVPFAGGAVQPGPFANIWPAERLTGFLRERNGCTESADVSDVPNAGRNRVVLFRWTRCSAPVESYRVMGGDHGAAWAVNNLGQVLLDFFRDKVRADAVAAATTTPSVAPARPPAADCRRRRAQFHRLPPLRVEQPDHRRNDPDRRRRMGRDQQPRQQVELSRHLGNELRGDPLRRQPRRARQARPGREEDAHAAGNGALVAARRYRRGREVARAVPQLFVARMEPQVRSRASFDALWRNVGTVVPGAPTPDFAALHPGYGAPLFLAKARRSRYSRPA